MEIETAIKCLESLSGIYLEGKELTAEIEARDIAIQALEKQIPKKPIKKNNQHRCPICPVCEEPLGDYVEDIIGNRHFVEIEYPYCFCGQKLVWD